MSVPFQVTEQFLRAAEDGRNDCRRNKYPPAEHGGVGARGREVLEPRPALPSQLTSPLPAAQLGNGAHGIYLFHFLRAEP